MHDNGGSCWSAKPLCSPLPCYHDISTWRCCHCAPQMAHAKVIGSSYLAATYCWSFCIYLSFHTAQQPHDPDASELDIISGCPWGLCTSNILWPIHSRRKVSHDSKSDQSSVARWIQWSSCCTLYAVSIILLKKMRPCLTTLQCELLCQWVITALASGMPSGATRQLPRMSNETHSLSHWFPLVWSCKRTNSDLNPAGWPHWTHSEELHCLRWKNPRIPARSRGSARKLWCDQPFHSRPHQWSPEGSERTAEQRSDLEWENQHPRQPTGRTRGTVPSNYVLTVSRQLLRADGWCSHGFSSLTSHCQPVYGRPRTEAIQSAVLQPKLWVRYVDDTFIIWPHWKEHLHALHEHWTNRIPTFSSPLKRRKRVS